jgi:5,10-methylenetetrahydromethanopterin reductase
MSNGVSSAVTLPALSCAFAPELATPDHIALAEELGYKTAYLFDSPAAYADPWMILALAATRTTRIGLGTAVLVPSLRHPVVNASAIATLAALAPGRVSAAFGTGFTGRVLVGEEDAMRWADVADYVRTLRGLLRGEEVQWQGKRLAMLHPEGFAPARPVDAQILLGAEGPKGLAYADELADGVIAVGPPRENDGRSRAQLLFGTVLDEGEQFTDPRVLAAAGPALAVAYHSVYLTRGAEAVDRLPGGQAWREAVEAVPAERRHLAIHEGHLTTANDFDKIIFEAAAGDIGKRTTSGTPEQIRVRLATLAAKGVSEVAYQPAGPDIERELRAFAAAAGAAS